MRRHLLTPELAASAGIFIGTYDTAAIAVVLPRLHQLWHLSSWQVALLGSSAFIGMLAGSLLGGMVADRFGRRRVLLLDFLTYGLAALGSALSPGWLLFVLWRGIVGIGIGADYATAFPYLAECAQPQRRGRVMAWALFAANFGMVMAYAAGGVWLASPQGWRAVLLLGAALVLPLLWSRRFLPESAAWLSARVHTWRQLASQFRAQDVRRAVERASVNWFLYQVSDQGLTVFLPTLALNLLASSMVQAAWTSVGIKLVTIPAALVTVLVIDRWGRRPLQVWGFLGRAVFLVALAVVLWWLPVAAWRHDAWALLALLALAYGFGAWGPDKTTVITTAEQLTPAVRGTGQGVSEVFGRLGGIAGIAGYSFLSAWGGPAAGLMLFGVTAFFGWAFSVKTLPETKAAVSSAQALHRQP